MTIKLSQSLLWLRIVWHYVVVCVVTGVADCVLALGFEKMERGSLQAKVNIFRCFKDMYQSRPGLI